MTRQRKRIVKRVYARICRICDKLEPCRDHLQAMGDELVDPSDPYSLTAEDAADNIDYAYRLLADQVLGLLGTLVRRAKKEEK